MEDWLNDYVATEFTKSISLLQAMSSDAALIESVNKAVGISTEAVKNDRKIMLAGNGGSAADAQHWAGELVSRFYFDRPGLAAVALTTDTSILTAIGNDYGYDYVFARQIEAIGQQGDVFFAISTSGNSKNIVRAIEASLERGVTVIGFTGQSGGAMADICDLCLHVPSRETPRIQEGHEVLGHLICALIEKVLFGHAKD